MAGRCLAALLQALVWFGLAARLVEGGCEYYTNCAACVADTTCGWCGNDPYHAGGFGFTLQGDHVDPNPWTSSMYMVGGVGLVTNSVAGSKMVTGQNTVFTRQFRGLANPNSANPFVMVVNIGGVDYVTQIDQVFSDTSLRLRSAPAADFLSFIPFTLSTPRGTGDLYYGPSSTEVIVPATGNREQLTILCGAGTNLPYSALPSDTNMCKFTKELRVGYLLVLDSLTPPKIRSITSIKSDTELTVDYDFNTNYTMTSSPLPHSNTLLATAGTWTYLGCPPRVGKVATGVGVIESHPDQATDFKNSGAIAANSGNLMTMSGSGTLAKHRIMGRGTRFETQFGKEANWAKRGSGGYHGLGPWVSVRLNYDWETQRVVKLGTSGTYAEYVAVLENSFSEPLLKHTHFNWYTMLQKGQGRIRSHGRRILSEAWQNAQAPVPYNENPSGQGTTSGSTRFLSELRTGFTITAAGQTRMVNSIASDTEMTIDRPFTLGQREFFPMPSSSAKAGSLFVRGLTRTKPFWPAGVSVEVVVTSATPPRYKYNVLYKTFKYTVDGDGNAADDSCTNAHMNNGTVCGLVPRYDVWTQLQDPQRQELMGVYIKWNKCDIGACSSATSAVAVHDSWRLHIADVENVDFYISREGERYMTDDNYNPPLCYNYGKCLAISDTATTVAQAMQRPQATGTGLVYYNATKFILSALPDPNNLGKSPTFSVDVSPGEVIRILVDPTNAATWVDLRVIRVLSNTDLASDFGTSIGSATSAYNFRILKCPGGRRSGTDHDGSVTSAPANSLGVQADDSQLAYLPHPEQTLYQTWSYKYCEVDPGCCGFKVSSVVDPQQFAYYSVKPDHSNYNFRIATFTSNDNIDMYTRRSDDGSGRPDTTNYHLTSVRESNPWAIDEDQPDFLCSTTTHLSKSALGGGTSAGWGADAYSQALGRFSQQSNAPDCMRWVTGVMGDNRYPLTTGASEYHARMFLELNFPNFACADSAQAGTAKGGFTGLLGSFKARCLQAGLQFVRDADVVLNSAQVPQYVVRLTESRKRVGGQFAKWHVEGQPSWPGQQRSGAVWWNRKVHIWDGFEMDFTFQITEPSQCGGVDKICDGGDGFAFVISNDARNIGGNFDCAQADCSDGMIGCPADGLGYGNSKRADTTNYFGTWQECTNGLKKSFAMEFDTFQNKHKWDPKQGKTSWWINATEFISYSDNHVGAFMTTDPRYPHQPWGWAQPQLRALHSDDENGAHFGSTPSVPTLADGQVHHVKIRYTRGFTTEKKGTGQITTTDIVATDADRRRLRGDANTRFQAELRTGFEFGYASRVKANVKVKMFRDQTAVDPETGAYMAGRQGPPVPGVSFADDGEACRVIKIIDDATANLEDTNLNATQEEIEVRQFNQPAFKPTQDSNLMYNIVKEFPGEMHVFIDDMDRWAFTTAIEDRDISKILDTDGNAYIGFTASSGSKGFARAGYDPEEVYQTTDILSWRFCNNPGCVPY